MKKTFTIVLLFGLFMLLTAQTGMQDSVQPKTKSSSVQEYKGGEHAPLIFTSTDTLPKGGTITHTHWMQYGWSPTGSDGSNEIVQQFNPEIFTFIITKMLSIPAHADNDSVGIGYAYYETSYDTTADAIWNGDTSNVFIDSDYFTHPLYGQYKWLPFKRVATDTTDFAYKIAVWNGAFIRFWFKGWNNTDNGSVLDDTTAFDWKLICEN